MLILKLSFAETEAYLIYVPIDVEEKVQKETEQDGQKEKLREEENTLERATTEHKRVGNKIHEETQQPKKSDEDICVEGAVSNLQEHDRKCYGTAMEEQQEMQHYQNGTTVYLNISKYILDNTDVGVLFFCKKKKNYVYWSTLNLRLSKSKVGLLLNRQECMILLSEGRACQARMKKCFSQSFPV